jgi:hypothetical protein
VAPAILATVDSAHSAVFAVEGEAMSPGAFRRMYGRHVVFKISGASQAGRMTRYARLSLSASVEDP